jgi:hypothetical protein
MGISWRQFITIDQQVAGESAWEGKNEPTIRMETSTPRQRTPTFEKLSYNSKNAHKWHEGIPPARRNYLSSLFPFRVLLKSFLPRSCWNGCSRPFRISLIHDCGTEWDSERALPSRKQSAFQDYVGWRLHASRRPSPASDVNVCYLRYAQQDNINKKRQCNNELT